MILLHVDCLQLVPHTPSNNADHEKQKQRAVQLYAEYNGSEHK